MRLEVWRTVLPAICFVAITTRAQYPDLSGKWQLSIMHYGQTEYTQLTLKADGAGWTGEVFGDAFTVTLNGSEIEVRCREKDQKGKDCGVLKGRLTGGVMNASGKLYGEESTCMPGVRLHPNAARPDMSSCRGCTTISSRARASRP
jgi:hypothetical protein